MKRLHCSPCCLHSLVFLFDMRGILWVLVVLILVQTTSSRKEEPPQWPQPLSVQHVGRSVGSSSSSSSSSSPRILVVLNMYSFIHWDVIDEHFSAYRDICEGGWFIKIVVLSAAKWSDRLLKWSHRNLHCYRQADNLKLEIRRFNHTIGEAILCLMSRLPTKDAMMFTSPLLCLVII